MHRVLAALRYGRLRLQDPLGSRLFGAVDAVTPDAGAHLSLQINDLTAYRDIATGGTIGAAEAYMAGKWTTSDLPGVMRLLAINRDVMNAWNPASPRSSAARCSRLRTGVAATRGQAAGATFTPTTTWATNFSSSFSTPR